MGEGRWGRKWGKGDRGRGMVRGVWQLYYIPFLSHVGRGEECSRKSSLWKL